MYMLLCAGDSFCVGITNDLEVRLGQHQLGADRKAYTFSRRPVTLVHASDFHDVYHAIAWEKQLKGWSRSKKKALIANQWSLVRKLAACTNGTSHYDFGEPPG